MLLANMPNKKENRMYNNTERTELIVVLIMCGVFGWIIIKLIIMGMLNG